VSHLAEHQYIRRKDFTTKITPIKLKNISDEDYDRDMHFYTILKEKQERSVEAGQLALDKGTLTVPVSYAMGFGGTALSILAAAITI